MYYCYCSSYIWHVLSQLLDLLSYAYFCIFVGSRYCDGSLRTNGFNGEGVYGPSVSAIKLHSINPLFTNMKHLPSRISNTLPVFGAAIILVRNPRDAMVAEWHRERTKRQTNRNVSNHFLYVGKEHFGEYSTLELQM